MIVYALNSYLKAFDEYDGMVTLYSIGEQNEVPKTVNSGHIITSYYTDINEARRAFQITKETHEKAGQHIQYNVKI